jgi:23S rRNA (cytosine1962-C5)-methyltransferase
MPALPRVTLKPGKAKPFWCGHPLVFSGAVQSVDAGCEAGALVAVHDAHGVALGVGVYNPASQYRVRILDRAHAGTGTASVADIVTRRVQAAMAARALLHLPSATTTAYRLLNSEGDGCSGLTVDMYGDVAVVASSAHWTEVHRPVIEQVLQALLKPATLLWRPVRRPLEQDGAAVRQEDGNQIPQPPLEKGDGQKIAAQDDTATAHPHVLENGLRFTVDLHGQKTGFYCDQRENRAWFEPLAWGRHVLDAFCFTGGFALYAARGGATQVVGIDSSAPAIALARANAAANQLTAEFQCADVLEYLATARGFDCIILDPPKLAATREHVPRALRYYRHVCGTALRVVRTPGLLVVCSCSAALGHDALQQVVRETAVEEKRTVQIVRVSGAAPDHPVLPAFPEGNYLTCLWLAVS